ncbi:MAG TPA: hypothetical protein VL989_01205 [Candidatus Sulfotelmatobacter sp.]|nr:hypothetical protein [Candidatus Sulfotelmatobacter sp.]
MSGEIKLAATTDALANLVTNSPILWGEHDHPKSSVGFSDFPLYHRPFDPELDDPSNIDHSSYDSIVMDEPHVAIIHPPRQLDIRVVAEQRVPTSLDERFGLGAARNGLNIAIARALEESLPGVTDEALLFSVGSAAARDQDFEVLTHSDDPEEQADLIRGLSHDGLTIVLSSFLRLDPKKLKSNQPMIAIKTNAPWDLELPKAGLVIRSGKGLGEVDLSDDRQRGEANRLLIKEDQRVVDSLLTAKIAVARAVFDKSSPDGVNWPRVDASIAQAIERAENWQNT